MREPMLDRIVRIRKFVHARAAKVSFALYVFVPLILFAFLAPRCSSSQLVAIALCVIAVGISAIFINRTPCPQCGHVLGMVASRAARSPAGAKCNACGTDIDAPLYNSAGQ